MSDIILQTIIVKSAEITGITSVSKNCWCRDEFYGLTLFTLSSCNLSPVCIVIDRARQQVIYDDNLVNMTTIRCVICRYRDKYVVLPLLINLVNKFDYLGQKLSFEIKNVVPYKSSKKKKI